MPASTAADAQYLAPSLLTTGEASPLVPLGTLVLLAGESAIAVGILRRR